MTLLNRTFWIFTILLSSLMVALASFAMDDSQPVTVGNITYITGGIGDESRTAIEANKHDYNLIITSAYSSGEFIGEAGIVIYNKSGEELLNTKAGPLFYVNLPKGNYIIEETLAEKVKKKNLNISKNQTVSNFIW